MMQSSADRVAGYVCDLVRGRRPRRIKASVAELEAMRAAAELVQARTGLDLPDPASLERIRARLFAELNLEQRGLVRTRALSRRSWLRTAGVAAAAALVGGAVERTLAESPGQETLVPATAGWRPVAAVSELPPGHSRAFATGAVQGVVVNSGGRIQALSAVCTHLGCLLTPNDGSQRLDCPCHRTSFDWTGQVVDSGVPYRPAPLPQIATRIRDGYVEVLVV